MSEISFNSVRDGVSLALHALTWLLECVTTPEGDAVHTTGCTWSVTNGMLHMLLTYEYFVYRPCEEAMMATLKIEQEERVYGKNKAMADPAQAAAEASYTREQVMSSRRYAGRRDLVSVLLEDGKQYTLAEADKRIEQFKKDKVN